VIAKSFGFENWNILSAKIQEAEPSASATPSASVESSVSAADIDALVKELGVQERVLMFCLASGTDWKQAGVTFKTVASQCFGQPSWARITVKIMPDGRLALTWAGHAALRALLRDQ
jgi:hypothetical protein